MDGALHGHPPEDWKIGVDIGGTFMDFCALETRSGRIASLKVLTTPNDPGAELGTGLDLLASREGLDPTTVSRFVHGTTVGINTIIQRKGAKLALFTNQGFEDVIELARLRMPDMYSLFCQRPDPLVPRDRIFGLPVRMSADGSRVDAPEQAVRDAIAQARATGAEGIIIALLHAWRDPGAGGGDPCPDRGYGAGPVRLYIRRGLASDPGIRTRVYRDFERLCAPARGGLP